jgi:hypothetical protein
MLVEIFKFTSSFQPHHGSGVYLAYNRNEHQQDVSRVKARPQRKADDLTAICETIVYTVWNPQRLTTL